MCSYYRGKSGSVGDEINISNREDEGTLDPDVVAQTYWLNREIFAGILYMKIKETNVDIRFTIF